MRVDRVRQCLLSFVLALLPAIGFLFLILVAQGVGAGEDDGDYTNYVNDGDFSEGWMYWTETGSGFSMVASCGDYEDCLKISPGVSGFVDQYFQVYDTGSGKLIAKFYMYGLCTLGESEKVQLLDPNENVVGTVKCQHPDCGGDEWFTKDDTFNVVETGLYRVKITSNIQSYCTAYVDDIEFTVNGQGPPEPLPLLDRMIWNASPECPFCGVQNAVGHVGGPINSKSGNLSYQETDLSFPVKGGELSFRRSYASGSTNHYTGTLGYGWTHNYDARLHFTGTALTNTVELQAPGGSRLPFFCSGDCTGSDETFTPYEGVTASLARITSTNPITTQHIVTGFNQTVYTFTHQGLLSGQADPFGNAITFTFNISGQLTRADQGERFLEYTYDESGRLKDVSDHISRTIHLEYDDNGDLTSASLVGVNKSLALTTTYSYSGTTHLLTKVVDPSERVVEETAYDSAGRAYRQWDAEDNLMVDINYELTNTVVVSESGVVYTHTYDNRGTLISTNFACTDGTPGCGAGTDSSYDRNFKAKLVKDANGNSTNLRWDVGGSNLESVTDALDNQTSLSYDSFNNLSQVINAREDATTYAYGNSDLPTFRTAITDALTNTTIYTPTSDGLLAAEKDPNGRLITYNYNEFGQVTQTVLFNGSTEAITTSYGYDSVGRLITITRGSQSESHTTLNVYDYADRLKATIDNWSGSDPDNWKDDCDTSAGARDSNICTRFKYDGAGRTISTTNALGHTNLTFYNSAGRVITSVVNYDGETDYSSLCTDLGDPDPDYNICSLTGYDDFGRVVTSTDSLGVVTLTRYDILGRVKGTIANHITVTEIASCSFSKDSYEDLCTVYEYDAVGNTIVVTDSAGIKTRSFYDELNRVEGTIVNWKNDIALSDCDDPSLPHIRDYNICTLYRYDEVGNTTVVTDTLGRLTRTFYDPLNRVKGTVANWKGESSTITDVQSLANCFSLPKERDYDICTLYGYDPAGNQITVTNSLTQTSLTVYDGANRPVIRVTNWDMSTTIDADGTGCADTGADPKADENLCTIATYDGLGRRESVKDHLGNVTEYSYDGLGRIITTTQYLDDREITTINAYDALGHLLSETDPEDNKTTYSYDTLGRRKISISAEGVVITYTYDATGRVVSTTNGLGHTTEHYYDPLGRRTSITDPKDNRTYFRYDAVGNQTAVLDAEGITTTYEYDDLNRLVAVVENDTGGAQTDDSNVKTEYGYDAIGNRVYIINARSITSSQTLYDGLNRPVVITDALTNTTQYKYDALGNRTVITDANGAVSLYNFDRLNRLLTTQYLSDAETITYTYDAANNRLTMIDGLGTTTYGYDDLYRLITVTDALSNTVVYSYDAVGNRTNLKYPDGQVVTYTYNADHRLIQDDDWDGGATFYDYDVAGRLISTTLPNGVQSTYGYDNANHLTSLVHKSLAGELIASYLYHVDKVGNREVVTETLVAPFPEGLESFVDEILSDFGQSTIPESINPSQADGVPSSSQSIATPAGLDNSPEQFFSEGLSGEVLLPTELQSAQQEGGVGSDERPDPVGRLEIRLARSTLAADGRDGTWLVVLATDAKGRPVADGTTVLLTARGGRLSISQAGTMDGMVFAWLQAGKQAGIGYVDVHAGGVSATSMFALRELDHDTVRLDDVRDGVSGPLPFTLDDVIERARNAIRVPINGLPQISRPGHKAIFDGGRLHLVPLDGETRVVPMTLTVELESVAIGEQTLLDLPFPGAMNVDGNSVSLRRGSGFVEEFVARDGGVEQRWIVENEPDQAGDLVISVDIETALDMVRAEGGSGYTFRAVDAETGGITPAASYGRAIALDSAGRAKKAWLRSSEMDPSLTGLHRYRLTMTIPLEWLEEASYPVLIDPLVGGLLHIESAIQSGTQQRPSVAYNSTDDEYLVVWQDDRNGSDDIYAQLVSADGLLDGQNFVVFSGFGDQQKPDVSYNADDNTYLVVWSSESSEIWGQIVLASGTIEQERVQIDSGEAESNENPAAAYSDSSDSWLVTWQALTGEGGNDVVARSVDGDSSPGTYYSVYATGSEETLPDVAANSTGDFLVVWEQEVLESWGSSDVYFRRVHTDSVAGAAFTVITGALSSQVAPAVTYNPDDDEYLVAWQDLEEGAVSNDYDTIWSRQVHGVTGTNQFVSGTFQVSGPEDADSVSPAATFFSPGTSISGTYLVAWEQTVTGGAIDLQARRIYTDSSLLEPILDLSEATGDQEHVALGFGPAVTSTLSAWTDERGGSPDVYARLVMADGSQGGEFKVHPVSGDQVKPQVAYNDDDDEYLIVWHDYRSGVNDADIYAQRVSAVGTLMGDNINVVEKASLNQTNPSVAYASGQGVYLAIWEHYDSVGAYNPDVQGRIISRTGSIVGTSIITVATGGAGNQASPNYVVFNSTSYKFLALWQQKDSGYWNIWGRHVSVTGTMGSEISITWASQHDVDAAASYSSEDDQYLIAWNHKVSSSNRDILGRRMSGSGTVSDTTAINISTANGKQRVPDVLFLSGSDSYVVVWQDNRNSKISGEDIYGQVVLTSGNLSGSNYAVGSSAEDETNPRLAEGDNGGALVVWQLKESDMNINLYGRRLSIGGQVMADTFTILDDDGDQDQPALAGNGSGEFFIAWRDDRNGSLDIYGSLFKSLRADFSASPRAGAVPLQVQFADISEPADAADQWHWQFGDGSTSTIQNPSHNYTTGGFFTVTMTITDTDTGETDTLTRTNYINAAAATVIEYKYDDLYRLTKAVYSGTISATFEYDYDPVGNMSAYTTTITGTVVVTREFDNANRLTISGDGSGSTTYDYDDNGNLVRIMPSGGVGEIAYGFNQRNLLITSTVDGGAGPMPIAEFSYDGDGNRVGQVDYTGALTTAITYTNDIIGLVQVLVADDGTEQVKNLFGLDLVLQDDGDQDLVLLADGLGSVRTEMVGESVEAVTTYRPYGELLSRGGTVGTAYGFTGVMHDNSTGLLYLRARYYHPALLSFLSVDPVAPDPDKPESFHAYVYSFNNPVIFTDPSGQTPWEHSSIGCEQIPISPLGPILPLPRSFVQIHLIFSGFEDYLFRGVGTIIDSNAVLTHDHLIPAAYGDVEIKAAKITDASGGYSPLSRSDETEFALVDGPELGEMYGGLSILVFKKHFSTDSVAESLGEIRYGQMVGEHALQAVRIGAQPGLYLTRIAQKRNEIFRKGTGGPLFHGIRISPDYTTQGDSGAPLYVGGVVRAVNVAGPGVYGAVTDLVRIRDLISRYTYRLNADS